MVGVSRNLEEVSALYARCLKNDSGAFKDLQKLVDGHHSGAACRALVQAGMVRMARFCELTASKGSVPTAPLLQEAIAALEAAVAGVVEHHSLRCLELSMQLMSLLGDLPVEVERRAQAWSSLKHKLGPRRGQLASDFWAPPSADDWGVESQWHAEHDWASRSKRIWASYQENVNSFDSFLKSASSPAAPKRYSEEDVPSNLAKLLPLTHGSTLKRKLDSLKALEKARETRELQKAVVKRGVPDSKLKELEELQHKVAKAQFCRVVVCLEGMLLKRPGAAADQASFAAAVSEASTVTASDLQAARHGLLKRAQKTGSKADKQLARLIDDIVQQQAQQRTGSGPLFIYLVDADLKAQPWAGPRDGFARLACAAFSHPKLLQQSRRLLEFPPLKYAQATAKALLGRDYAAGEAVPADGLPCLVASTVIDEAGKVTASFLSAPALSPRDVEALCQVYEGLPEEIDCLRHLQLAAQTSPAAGSSRIDSGDVDSSSSTDAGDVDSSSSGEESSDTEDVRWEGLLAATEAAAAATPTAGAGTTSRSRPGQGGSASPADSRPPWEPPSNCLDAFLWQQWEAATCVERALHDISPRKPGLPAAEPLVSPWELRTVVNEALSGLALLEGVLPATSGQANSASPTPRPQLEAGSHPQASSSQLAGGVSQQLLAALGEAACRPGMGTADMAGAVLPALGRGGEMATLIAQREAQRLGSLADSPRAVSRLFSGSDDATVALLVPNPLQQLAEGQKDLLGAAARVLVAACLPRPSDLMRDCGDGAGWEQRGDPLSRFQAAVDEARARMVRCAQLAVDHLLRTRRLLCSVLRVASQFVQECWKAEMSTVYDVPWRVIETDVDALHGFVGQLGQLRLPELLRLYAFLCIQVAKAFSNPADVAPDVAEAMLQQSPAPQLQLLDRSGAGCVPGNVGSIGQPSVSGVPRSAASRAGSAGRQAPVPAATAAQQARLCQDRVGSAGKKGRASFGQELQYCLEPESLLAYLNARQREQGQGFSSVAAVKCLAAWAAGLTPAKGGQGCGNDFAFGSSSGIDASLDASDAPIVIQEAQLYMSLARLLALYIARLPSGIETFETCLARVKEAEQQADQAGGALRLKQELEGLIAAAADNSQLVSGARAVVISLSMPLSWYQGTPPEVMDHLAELQAFTISGRKDASAPSFQRFGEKLQEQCKHKEASVLLTEAEDLREKEVERRMKEASQSLHWAWEPQAKLWSSLEEAQKRCEELAGGGPEPPQASLLAGQMADGGSVRQDLRRALRGVSGGLVKEVSRLRVAERALRQLQGAAILHAWRAVGEARPLCQRSASHFLARFAAEHVLPAKWDLLAKATSKAGDGEVLEHAAEMLAGGEEEEQGEKQETRKQKRRRELAEQRKREQEQAAAEVAAAEQRKREQEQAAEQRRREQEQAAAEQAAKERHQREQEQAELAALEQRRREREPAAAAHAAADQRKREQERVAAELVAKEQRKREQEQAEFAAAEQRKREQEQAAAELAAAEQREREQERAAAEVSTMKPRKSKGPVAARQASALQRGNEQAIGVGEAQQFASVPGRVEAGPAGHLAITPGSRPRSRMSGKASIGMAAEREQPQQQPAVEEECSDGLSALGALPTTTPQAAAAGHGSLAVPVGSLRSMQQVAAAAAAVLEGRARGEGGKAKATVLGFDGRWRCDKCGSAQPVDKECLGPRGTCMQNPCRPYLMGRCLHQGRCGRSHPAIPLPADNFPELLPWEDVAVVPAGALEGKQASKWRELLQKHASRLGSWPGPSGGAQQAQHGRQQSGRQSAAQQAQQAEQNLGSAQPAGTAQLGSPGPHSTERQAADAGAGVTRFQQASALGAWDGTWLCDCGAAQGGRNSRCKACHRRAPCWRWMAGTCSNRDCPFPHPPLVTQPAAAAATLSAQPAAAQTSVQPRGPGRASSAAAAGETDTSSRAEGASEAEVEATSAGSANSAAETHAAKAATEVQPSTSATGWISVAGSEQQTALEPQCSGEEPAGQAAALCSLEQLQHSTQAASATVAAGAQPVSQQAAEGAAGKAGSSQDPNLGRAVLPGQEPAMPPEAPAAAAAEPLKASLPSPPSSLQPVLSGELSGSSCGDGEGPLSVDWQAALSREPSGSADLATSPRQSLANVELDQAGIGGKLAAAASPPPAALPLPEAMLPSWVQLPSAPAEENGLLAATPVPLPMSRSGSSCTRCSSSADAPPSRSYSLLQGASTQPTAGAEAEAAAAASQEFAQGPVPYSGPPGPLARLPLPPTSEPQGASPIKFGTVSSIDSSLPHPPMPAYSFGPTGAPGGPWEVGHSMGLAPGAFCGPMLRPPLPFQPPMGQQRFGTAPGGALWGAADTAPAATLMDGMGPSAGPPGEYCQQYHPQQEQQGQLPPPWGPPPCSGPPPPFVGQPLWGPPHQHTGLLPTLHGPPPGFNPGFGHPGGLPHPRTHRSNSRSELPAWLPPFGGPQQLPFLPVEAPESLETVPREQPGQPEQHKVGESCSSEEALPPQLALALRTQQAAGVASVPNLGEPVPRPEAVESQPNLPRQPPVASGMPPVAPGQPQGEEQALPNQLPLWQPGEFGSLPAVSSSAPSQPPPLTLPGPALGAWAKPLPLPLPLVPGPPPAAKPGLPATETTKPTQPPLPLLPTQVLETGQAAAQRGAQPVPAIPPQPAGAWANRVPAPGVDAVAPATIQAGPSVSHPLPALQQAGQPTQAATPWQARQQQGAQEQVQPQALGEAQPQVEQQQREAAVAGGVEEDHLSMLQALGVSGELAAHPAPASAEPAASTAWRSVLMQHVVDELGAKAGPGLTNQAGEYNCFLNAIIQCLWRCEGFRQQVLSWPAALCQHDAVVAALHGLFLQLEEQGQQQQQHAQHAERSVVNPNPLREALSALPSQLFRVGEMSDAGEVLLALYGRIEALDAAAAQALAAVFGLRVQEYVYCEGCELKSHVHTYTQYFYNTQATGLREERRRWGGGAKMGALLRAMEEQARKTCDQDGGGCNTLLPVVHALVSAPRVFTLQLAWESHQEQPHNIAATLAAVDERVDLHAVYRGVNPGQHVYRLRSLVCYYGAHYFAFVLVPELMMWVMFDDTRVSKVGSWADVRRKCEVGRIQPSVLFYEQVQVGV